MQKCVVLLRHQKMFTSYSLTNHVFIQVIPTPDHTKAQVYFSHSLHYHSMPVMCRQELLESLTQWLPLDTSSPASHTPHTLSNTAFFIDKLQRLPDWSFYQATVCTTACLTHRYCDMPVGGCHWNVTTQRLKAPGSVCL